MADYIIALDPADQRLARGLLRAWLTDDDLDTALHAIGVAEALGDTGLLSDAIREATRRGVHDDPLPTAVVPPWLAYHFRLLSALTVVQTPVGLEFMESLTVHMRSRGRARRRLGLSARLRLCFLQQDERHGDCVADVMQIVRRWDDPRLSRSAEGLITGLWLRAGQLDLVRGALTPSEVTRVSRFRHRNPGSVSVAAG